MTDLNNDSIVVSNVSKSYRLYKRQRDRIKEVLNPFGRRFSTEFKALEDVSFTIKKGERVGIIGANGAGKSTLLKIITGILYPTQGTVQCRGLISSLLELGTGFNPELSGYDNIYFYGSLLGKTKKDMDVCLEDILRFADIGEFVGQPVKTYSSGMFARLAFSVAINCAPDILIVDEVLSVGDMRFQEKSITRMKEFKNNGTSILFVSHSLPAVRNFCDRCIWLKAGRVVMDDRADIVCEEYKRFMNKDDGGFAPFGKFEFIRNPIKKIQIVSCVMDKEEYTMGDNISITTKLCFNQKVDKYGFGVTITDKDGELVTTINTLRDDIVLCDNCAIIEIKINDNDFVFGEYFITAIISDEMAMFPYDKAELIARFTIKDKVNFRGLPIASGMFRCKHEWIVDSKIID